MKKLLVLLLLVAGCSRVQMTPNYKAELDVAAKAVRTEAEMCEAGKFDPNDYCEALDVAATILEDFSKAAEGGIE